MSYLDVGCVAASMQKFNLNKRSVLRVLVGVYLLPLWLVFFSLSVPPTDLPLCGLMFGLAVLGLVLAWRESRAWRIFWISALILSVVLGVLEVMAGKRIAHQRLEHPSSIRNITFVVWELCQDHDRMHGQKDFFVALIFPAFSKTVSESSEK